MSACSTADCGRMVYCKKSCKKCYMKAYRQKPEQVRKRKLYNKAHYQANKEMYKLKQLKWNLLNPEKRRQHTINGYKKFHQSKEYKKWLAEYNKITKHMSASRAAKRRAALLLACPKWLSKEQHDQIKQMYATCPSGYQVDHIVPLKGKHVCGLHVPWNLQHLSREENAKKYNKY